MKTIKVTADYTTSVTRYIRVDDDFNPATEDLDALFFSKDSSALSRSELEEAMGNLQYDEAWLVRDENDKEIYAK